ncbi:phosphate acetyltransferase [Motilibacter peucedani]|uniref:Phosphate acetyltransferase n=1 Tax=Motilibacter peucedani TaxID=598650 RepID=A0A420XKY3_9ACTN|nr:phosphate acetyltransferase [Motilibacter peucedani]RKS68568.1 phosphate acetyltransferase [Motilibacter peucedani]
MNRTVLVVSTGHGAGLTATCLGLVRALDLSGVRVGYLKPLAQPGADDGASDPSTALVRLVSTLRPPESLPAAQVERLLGSGGIDSLMEDVVAGAEEVAAASDVVVVEGLTPAPELAYAGRANAALAKALDADVLLVAPWGDGDLERIGESIAIAGGPFRAGEDDRVIGAVVSAVPEPTHERAERLREALAARGVRLVAAVPLHEELGWARVRDLRDELDLEVLNEGDQDRRVKDVIVAAQSVPALLPLLREGRLVVVPGDRHEVVLSACLAAMNGIRLAALLLTVGEAPDPRVWELARPAAATGLPILLSRDYTYETANAVHGVDPGIRPDDRERAELVAQNVADAVDDEWLATLPTRTHTRLSPAAFRQRLTTMARAADRRIVLPEGEEPRTLRAAILCSERGIARPVLLGDPAEIRATASGLGLSLPDGLDVVDPRDVLDDYVDELVQARASKGLTPEVARDSLADRIVLGTTMLRAGAVDGLVAGAVHTTAATVRPALQILKTAPGAKLVSSVFFMCLPDQVVIYGDCAVNPDPDAEQLADIAVQSARSARAFGIEPRVAMISFSTGTSGSGSDVEKVAEATRLARLREPDLAIDGPLQYDAAAIASVARSKAPDSAVAGRATVFVFPDLNTGNTTYKAVQRSADVVSVGPMLQGLRKPVNDLSRGALVEDIVYTIALTAIQASMLD